MDITINPGSLQGGLRIPASKSMAIRAIAAAMLADGKSKIFHPSQCDDALAMQDVARQMGATIQSINGHLEVSGNFKARVQTFNCGESGLAARLMIAILALFDAEMTLTGEGTILNRNLGAICKDLAKLGVDCSSRNGFLPYTVKGPMRGGRFEVDGSGGSQFISGLLMALPLAQKNSVLRVRNLKSTPYIDMTLEVLQKFGIEIQHQNHETFHIQGNQKYKAASIEIEGDWSGAAFPMVGAALAGDLIISGLNPKSLQADRQIMAALEKSGVEITKSESGYLVKKSKLRAFEFDATHCPDLFPPLAVLAAKADGTSIISGVSRLSQKESNRGLVLKKELGKLGIEIVLEGDLMKITGGKIKGGTLFSHNDHRIAMAGAIAALVADGPVTIQNAECVSKSYPEFFEDLKSLNIP